MGVVWRRLGARLRGLCTVEFFIGRQPSMARITVTGGTPVRRRRSFGPSYSRS